MAETEIIKLIENFRVSYPTLQARMQNSDELLYPAINITEKDGDLYSVLGNTGNRLILDTFLEVGTVFAGENIKETIAHNPNAPVDILDMLSKASENIQMKLLSNPNLSRDTLVYLSRYGKAWDVKNGAKRQLLLRKFKPKTENDLFLKGEITFSLKETPYIAIPSETERAESLSIAPNRCSFISSDYSHSNPINFPALRFLAKNEEKAYLAEVDTSTARINLLIEIERVAIGEYRVIKLINEHFNIDEL